MFFGKLWPQFMSRWYVEDDGTSREKLHECRPKN